MGMLDDFLAAHAASSGAASDIDAWARALSLTGALLSHLADSPETQPLVFEMLAAGVTPTPAVVPGATDPFDEVLSGLQARELREPELFQRYFGAV